MELSGLRLNLLGPLEVRAGATPIELRGRRPRALLCVLALQAGQPVPVDVLLDRVWGSDLPVDPRGSLHTSIGRIRRALGATSVARHGGGYRLSVDPEQVDALRFMATVARADQVAGAGARDVLAEALALWRSTPFEEPLSRWLTDHEQPRLVERYLAAVERRVDLDLAAGRHREVVSELRQLAARHPLREPLWARLLMALDHLGRRAEALDAYETIRRHLAEQLGVDPGVELKAVFAALLAEGPAPARAAETPTRSQVPRQLPRDVRDFTGRQAELAALDEILAHGDGSPPVVAIHGPGGVGKTALAVRWAHRVSSRFPDGQLFIDLRGYGPHPELATADALDVLLRGLGVDGVRIPDGVEARSALLRTRLAGRRMLVVLDNVRSAQQVRPLLPGPGSLVVVTSRNDLRGLAAREGARRLSVDTLSAEEAVDLLGRRLPATAPLDSDVLAELAGLCGRLPLALAIAAERASPSLPIAHLVADLRREHERLDALTSGDDPLSDVRAVMSWSHRALDEDAARLFALLGLHPRGECGVEAAAALAGRSVSWTRRRLDRLSEQHLVTYLDEHRLTMHDLLRDYAVERCADLPADDRDEARQRLWDWYLHTAANARLAIERVPLILTLAQPAGGVRPREFDDGEAASAWLDAERPTMLALSGDAAQVAEGGPRPLAFQLPHAMANHLLYTLPFSAVVAVQSRALAVATRLGDDMGVAVSANHMGVAHFRNGSYAEAAAFYEQALTHFERAGHLIGQCGAETNLGLCREFLGDHEDALRCHQRSRALAAELGSPPHLATALINIGSAYLALDRPDRAAESAEEALATGADSLRLRAHAHEVLGHARLASGDADAAIDALEAALAGFQAVGDPVFGARTLKELGEAHRLRGENGLARECWRRAVAMLDQLDWEQRPAVSRDELVDLLSATEEPA